MVNEILDEVESEFVSASNKFGPFNSEHEGYAVLLEEMDELWEQIRLKPELRDKFKMKKECIQICAMAIRFIHDLCPEKE
jgi:hypothetical protein